MFAESAFDHVQDTYSWHLFFDRYIDLPWPVSKYVILMLLASVAILLIYVPIANKAKDGSPPRGYWWNCFEIMLEFVRDEVARPCLGHDTDRYVPYLWTTFLFILFCNLGGLFPFLASPTASFTVTAALAFVTFFFIHGGAVARMGVWNYLKSYVPHVDVPFGMGYFIVPLIIFIEAIGNVIKCFVLAIRLFANVFAGHVVLAFILFFIVLVKNEGPFLFWGVTVSSVLGVTALSLLELFVAFLQAYVFTFLAALFLGMALHPQH